MKSKSVMYLLTAGLIGLLVFNNHAFAQDTEYWFPANPVTFGNTTYMNFSVGEEVDFTGNSIEVLEIKQNLSLIRVNNEQEWLDLSKRTLPKNIGGLRIFVADQIYVKNLTDDSRMRNMLQKDVLLGISDPNDMLLEASGFTFPISRADGYTWTMEEDSHMFAYLGSLAWRGQPNRYRSHEGIDLNMHEAMGKEFHPLVAIESSTVVLSGGTEVTGAPDGCIILKSDSQENIYYVYKHTNPATHMVKAGDKVEKGDKLSYILSDGSWGHLHFAIVYRNEIPTYRDRYTNVLNIFPQMYELHFGSLEPIQTLRTEDQLVFSQPRPVEDEYFDNSLKLDEFNPFTGFGWRMGDWCPSKKVERATRDGNGNVRIRRTLHANTKAECRNPKNYYDFEVAVENGTYLVNAIVGDVLASSGQIVYFQDTKAGRFELGEGEYETTEEIRVVVSDNKLTVRLELIDDQLFAGIKELNFRKL